MSIPRISYDYDNVENERCLRVMVYICERSDSGATGESCKY
jgi:hypothetical protein